jgi:hypothetical protein
VTLVRVAHGKGSRIYYSLEWNVIPYFEELDLLYRETAKG